MERRIDRITRIPLALFVLFFLFASPVEAQSPFVTPLPLPPPAPLHITPDGLVPEEEVTRIALEEGLSDEQAYQMVETVRGESSFDPLAVGDHGESCGIAQINTPAHPNLPCFYAKSHPEFSLRWMAARFLEGHARWWTVWCTNFGADSPKCYNYKKLSPPPVE